MKNESWVQMAIICSAVYFASVTTQTVALVLGLVWLGFALYWMKSK